MVARRRQVLGLLAALTAVAVVAGLAGWLSWSVATVPALLLVAYVAQLRRLAVGSRVARPGGRSEAAPAAAAGGRRPAPRRVSIKKPARPKFVAGATSAEQAETWEPVPVPVPTYVNAPRADRPSRRIDLTGDVSWTSGRMTAHERAAVEPAAIEAERARVREEELQRRRAVND